MKWTELEKQINVHGCLYILKIEARPCTTPHQLFLVKNGVYFWKSNASIVSDPENSENPESTTKICIEVCEWWHGGASMALTGEHGNSEVGQIGRCYYSIEIETGVFSYQCFHQLLHFLGQAVSEMIDCFTVGRCRKLSSVLSSD